MKLMSIQMEIPENHHKKWKEKEKKSVARVLESYFSLRIQDTLTLRKHWKS